MDTVEVDGVMTDRVQNKAVTRPGGRCGGFTLLELVVTLAVAGILVAVAIPSYRGIVQTNTLTSVANNLVAAFNFARSEAITRGATVYICPSEGTTRCGGDWLDGWVIYVPDASTQKSKPTKDNRLRVHDAVTMPHLASKDDGFGDATLSKVQFGGSGFASGSAGSITLCNTGSQDSVKVVISPSGRVRVETKFYQDGSDCMSKKS